MYQQLNREPHHSIHALAKSPTASESIDQLLRSLTPLCGHCLSEPADLDLIDESAPLNQLCRWCFDSFEVSNVE